MNSRDFTMPHPSEEQLLRLSDGELAERDANRLRGHLELCWTCRGRNDDLQAGIAAFVKFESGVVRTLFPEPPQPWADLRRILEASDAASAIGTKLRPQRFSNRWLAAAAAVLLCVLLVWRFQRVPSVRAAELLRKAAVAEKSKPAKSRQIRIRTRLRTLTRPAPLKQPLGVAAPAQANDDGELQKLFESAHYSWDDPLSVDAYRAWWQQLPEKQDDVQTIRDGSGTATSYVVRTNTGASVLTEASLTLRASDLHAVNETLDFHPGERVEISEVSEAGNETAAPTAPRLTQPAMPATRKEETAPLLVPNIAEPGQEVQVAVALHRLGADVGEPVEVTRQGSTLIVATMGLSATRRAQLLAAVGQIPGVELRFDEPRLMRSQPSVPLPPRRPPASTTSTLMLKLESRLADPASLEEVTNRILDASDAAMARAYALRALARRFGPEVEATLGLDDRAALAGIRRDHLQALAARAQDLDRELQPALEDSPTLAGEPAAASGSWQNQVLQIFESTQRVDRIVNALLAGSDAARGEQSLRELAAALGRLQRDASPQP